MWMANEKFYFIEPITYIECKCAAFDLDGCLITKADTQIPSWPETKRDNFVFMYNVEATIFDLLNNGTQVVIITNQSNFNQIKGEMILDIWEHFEGRVLILAAHLKNEYRKPNIGFIDLLRTCYEIEFYCGDAIGEDNTDFPSFQWGSSDFDFAKNGGVKFYNPIEVFGSNFETVVPTESLIITCGTIGSGKSSVAKRLESIGFERFSKDEVNYLAKFRVKAITEFLKAGKQVVVDSTFYNNKVRNVWIDLAESIGCSWHILWCVRDGRPFNAKRDNPVTDKAAVYYVNHCERPTSNYTVVN